MQEHLQLVLIELKRQKKSESFPDHICAQANRIARHAGRVCENADLIKYDDYENSNYKIILKTILISTMACCLRMLEELEK